MDNVDNYAMKGKLLEHYSKKHPEKYYQLDTFNFFDSVIEETPGEIVTCMGVETWELMNSPFVARLLVKDGADAAEVVASLKGMLRWVENGICVRCYKTLGDHHLACKDESLTDEQVQAIVNWEKKKPINDIAHCPF